MIANAYVIPTEFPPRLLDIKRSLLTYDQVIMPSPDDRELIPPNAFTIAQGLPPVFGMSVGAVRPLGKTPNYDLEFERLVDSLGDAIDQDILIVRDAPVYQESLTIGAVPIPDGIPNPTAVYQIYRQMASDPSFIGAIARGIDYMLNIDANSVDTLAPSGADDGGFQTYLNGVPQPGLPATATYNGYVMSEEYREILTRVCWARLGALVKSLLICSMDMLQPYSSDDGIASVMQLLSNNTRLVFDRYGDANEEVATLNRLNRLHDIVVAEFVDREYLDALPISEILRLRTTAWGNAQEASVSAGCKST